MIREHCSNVSSKRLPEHPKKSISASFCGLFSSALCIELSEKAKSFVQARLLRRDVCGAFLTHSESF